MSYEQKYNAALERAGKELQELKNKDCDDMTRRTAITIIHNLFPELQESEDERIRKVLLNDFKNNCSEYYCEGVNRDMIIAWLEKQGEKKTDFSNIRVWKYIVDMVLTEENGIGQYLDSPDTERIAKKLQEKYGNIEKQDESLNESVYDTEDKEMYQAISIGLTDLFNEFGWSDFGGMPIEDIQDWLEKQGEQKQTWKPSAAQLIVIKDLIEDKNTSNVNKTILRGMFDEIKQFLSPNSNTEANKL